MGDHRPLQPARLFLALAVIRLFVPDALLFAQPVVSYASMVEHYAHGDVKDAIAELSQWGDHRGGEIAQSMRQLAPGQLRAAAMLHTDFAGAMALLAERNRAAVHIQIASGVIERILSRGPADDSTREFVVRWHVFVSSLYLTEGSLTEARDIVGRGMRTFPGSAELWVARGTVAEMFVRFNQRDDRIERDGPTGASAKRIEAQLTAAELVFAHAIVLDKTSTVAHLHRGWILHLLHDKRATDEFHTALSIASDDRDRHLAHLFLGVAAEDNKELDTAAREYEAAYALGAYQTVCVALSRVEEERGRTARAREIVSMYAHQAGHAEDPWWDFHLGGLNVDMLTWLRGAAAER